MWLSKDAAYDVFSDAEQHKKDKAKKRAAMRNTGPLTPEQAAIKIQKVRSSIACPAVLGEGGAV